jgi:hypothetical protein
LEKPVNIRLAAVAIATAVPLSLWAGAANASGDGYGGGYETIGEEGCRPGYWRNRLGIWQQHSPSTSLRSVFSAVSGTRFASTTMAQALSLHGGSGVDGARQILLRAGTAAVLNAAHGRIDYSLTKAAVVRRVNTALKTGDRQIILDAAAALDRANNLGCPL